MIFNTQNKNPNIAVLNCIYQNAKTDEQNITQIIGKIDNNELQNTLLEQLTECKELGNQASEMLTQYQVNPKETMLDKITNKAGITVNTLTDTTASHIAEIMISENTINVINLTRKINENKGCQKNILELGNNFITLSEKNVKTLKNFL